MSDFIFSRHVVDPGKLTREIQKIFSEDKPLVDEFHGEWGSLAVSRNHYNGFLPYENSKHIFIVIGGPILYFRKNDFLDEQSSNIATKEIYKLWYEKRIRWDKDLSGPFAVIIIDKETGNIEFITDLMSFIPIYVYQDANSNNILISTHVDVLAKVSGRNKELDIISCSDFILHGVVTFPYTLYKDIFQVQPASIHHIIKDSNKIQSEAYWIPEEIYVYNSVKDAAEALLNSLRNYINHITSNVSNVAQFISGGEDSRVLTALLKKYPRDAYIFLDYMNREGIIAKKVAEAYHANFKLATRSKTHYIEILPRSADLIGSGLQYHHAHTFRFHKDCKLIQYGAVFGGLFSDALLKGSRIKKKNISKYLLLVPEIKDEHASRILINNNKFLSPVILEKINIRRKEHLEYIKSFRKESAHEWVELWPSSMNFSIANIHANRRLFKSYEPFLANEVIKISASIPQKWKLNRKLFRTATKSLLKRTKWVSHSDGRLPYFPWYVNSILQFLFRVNRRIGLKIGYIKGNQGPWGEWKNILKSHEWRIAVTNYKDSFKLISSAFSEKDVTKILNDDSIHHFQRINLLQLLYQIKKMSEN